MLPSDIPLVSTVWGYFYVWRKNGLRDEMNRKLVEAVPGRALMHHHQMRSVDFPGKRLAWQNAAPDGWRG